MGRLLTAAAVAFLLIAPMPGFAGHVNPNWQYVPGYHRHDGTYVRPYHRTVPNGTKCDNYTNPGNVNPWNGIPGTKSPAPERCPN